MTKKILKAGFAKLALNPPFGCEMAGFVARKGGCQGVHDQLWARALVLSNNGEKIAIVAADILGIDRDTVGKIRLAVAALTDLRPEQVMICAIHTHAGPVTIERGFLGQPSPDYINFLIKNITGAIYGADQRLEPVDAAAGSSQCLLVGKNRRHPGGPTDPTVSVLKLSQNGNCKVILVNYACHPVVLGPDNLLLSADYPYYLIQTLEAVYPGAEIIFTNGATGDINVGHNAAASINGCLDSKRTFAEAERLGRILASSVIEAVEMAIPLVDTTIHLASQQLALDLEQVLDKDGYQKEAERFKSETEKLQNQSASFGLIQQAIVWKAWAERMKTLSATGRLEKKLQTEVTAFKIGEIEFVTFPGEFFHELGLQVRNSRSGKMVFILGYANDIIGYVGTTKAYQEGGYEIDDSFRYFGLPARLAPGAGEKVAEEATTLLQKLSK